MTHMRSQRPQNSLLAALSQLGSQAFELGNAATSALGQVTDVARSLAEQAMDTSGRVAEIASTSLYGNTQESDDKRNRDHARLSVIDIYLGYLTQATHLLHDRLSDLGTIQDTYFHEHDEIVATHLPHPSGRLTPEEKSEFVLLADTKKSIDYLPCFEEILLGKKARDFEQHTAYFKALRQAIESNANLIDIQYLTNGIQKYYPHFNMNADLAHDSNAIRDDINEHFSTSDNIIKLEKIYTALVSNNHSSLYHRLFSALMNSENPDNRRNLAELLRSTRFIASQIKHDVDYPLEPLHPLHDYESSMNQLFQKADEVIHPLITFDDLFEDSDKTKEASFPLASALELIRSPFKSDEKLYGHAYFQDNIQHTLETNQQQLVDRTAQLATGYVGRAATNPMRIEINSISSAAELEIMLKKIIGNEKYWKSKTHFTVQKSPCGVKEMRGKIASANLKSIAEIADSRLAKSKNMMYLLFGKDTRDHATYQFYKVCSKAQHLIAYPDSLDSLKQSNAMKELIKDYNDFVSHHRASRPAFGY